MTANSDAVFADATATQRFLAYFDWAGQALLTPADLVIFADPKLRVALTERWQEQVDRWLHVPAGTTADRRRRCRRAPDGRRALVRPCQRPARDLRRGSCDPPRPGRRAAGRCGMSPSFLLFGAILTEVVATLSLRGALDHPALYTVVVVGYAASFGSLALVLRRGMALGVAYGIWSACGVVLTAILSALAVRGGVHGAEGQRHRDDRRGRGARGTGSQRARRAGEAAA